MQIGLSPKVLNPALVLLAAGMVLAVGGHLLDDPALSTLGYGALGSALATLGVGYRSKPGEVVQGTTLPGSDATLSANARKQLL
jgi:hypothetical protein